jgi:hypothetical protein
MALVRVVVDGAAEAAKLFPLLFALNGAPADAQLPRAVPVGAHADQGAPAPGGPFAPFATVEPLVTIEPLSASTFTLTQHHLEVHVDGTRARIVQRVTWRNDGAAPASARYVLPASARIAQSGVAPDGEPGAPADAATPEQVAEEEGGSAEISADGALFVEAGEADPSAWQSGVVWLAAGEELTVHWVRPGTVLTRHGRHRIVLPLTVARDASFTPQFSAEVIVHGPQPVKSLASATHGGIVSGLGEELAFLTVPNGRVYEGQHFALEFEFGRVDPPPAMAWGNEGRSSLRAAYYPNR